MALHIIFDGPPGPEGGRFVEVENDFGESVKAGEWLKNDDGTWTLRIDEIPPSAVRHYHVAGDDTGDKCAECGMDIRSKIHHRISSLAR